MITDGIQITIGQVIWWSFFIGAAAWLSFLVYRAMDHPRLVLTQTPAGPRALLPDVAKYAISMPFLILLWWAFFFVVFLINDNHINVVQLFVFPSALIVSIRALAFLSPVTARELGKVLPVALVAFVILDGSLRNPVEIDEMLEQAVEIDTDDLTIVFVLFVDYLFTAIWYWGWIRWGQPRLAEWKAGSGEQVADDDGGVAILADTDGADGRT